MEKFVIYNPTKLYFGNGSIENLEDLRNLGKKCLIIFGRNSSRENGAYEDVIKILGKLDKDIIEFWGIKPNPRIEEAERAKELGIREQVDFVIGVGGGSVIDTAKLVAQSIPENLNIWDVVSDKIKPNKALPIIAIITISGTGTEMNCFAVIQNDELRQKLGYANPLIYPFLSICDPKYTLTVPKNLTSYGIADIVAHLLESYFAIKDCTLTEKFIFSILNEVIEFAPYLLNNLKDIKLRERMMLSSICALNGITFYGIKTPDWGVHDIAHNLSALFDVPHGASLSITYIAWLKHFKNKLADKITTLGKNVFNVHSPEETINSLKLFFEQINCPTSLTQLNFSENQLNELKNLLLVNKPSGYVFELFEEDLISIFNFML